MSNEIDTYKEALARYLGDAEDTNVFLYWKGRVGLYAILRSMGIGDGDEVIVPAYTCVAVPNAVFYTGAKAIYVDIEEDTYNIDIAQIEAKITKNTKAILCQNTYGLSTNLEKLTDLAKVHGLYTIEDCTHGYAGTYDGKPNGTFCDAAFFSTQWNKPFTTGIGGFVVTRDTTIAKNLQQIESEKCDPSMTDVCSLWMMYAMRRYFLNDYSYWSMRRFYRFLSRNNLVLGSSSGEELMDAKIPDNFLKGFSRTQAKQGLKSIPKLEQMLNSRREMASTYTSRLTDEKKTIVPIRLHKDHSFLTYPALVSDRKQFMSNAERDKVQVNDWFNSPLHPIAGDLTPWNFHRRKFATAEYISDHVVNLPTTPANKSRVLNFLDENMSLLM